MSDNIQRKKKSPTTVFYENFIKSDINEVKKYVINGYVIPTIVDLIANTCKKAIDATFYGTKNIPISENKEKRNTSFISYRNGPVGATNVVEKTSRLQSNVDYSCDDITFSSEVEAKDFLARCDEILNTYPTLSVADVYDMAGFIPTPTDHDYGWNNLLDVRCERLMNGRWILRFPKIIALPKKK